MTILYGVAILGQELPVCEGGLEMGFVPWSPLGMGYLTGKVTPTTKFPNGDLREMFLRFPPGALKANWCIVELLATLGKEKNATPGKIALA